MSLGSSKEFKASLDALKVYKTVLSAGKDYSKEFLEKKALIGRNSCEGLWLWTTYLPFPYNVASFLATLLCYTLYALAHIIGFGIYYFTLVSYHVTSVTYESLSITKVSIDYAKESYYDAKYYDQWLTESLGIINVNIGTQHQQMKDQLASQHEIMLNRVNKFTNCRVELHGYDMTRSVFGDSAEDLLLKANPDCRCILFANKPENNDCSTELQRRRLVSEEMIVNSMTNPQGKKLDEVLNNLDEIIDNDEEMLEELKEFEENEEEIIDNQVDMKNITTILEDRMATLQETVDGIAKKLDMNPKSDAKSKKSKKAKSQPKEAQDSETDDALFHRNLLAVEEAVMDKFDKMESQVKLVEGKVDSMEKMIEGKMESQAKLVETQVQSIEGKVESMETQVQSIENKVQSIEGKVDNMEKTMEEMKDMLSQLMMNRGAAEADA